MYIYHLHNYKQIGQEKYYNGECIRFLLEDIIHAENKGIDWLNLIYGTASRYDLRSKIYPSFMTYRKWIELSNNYPKIILSLNFDVHSYKYKEFCKKVLKQFPRNKKIIVAAGNEVYEKRGSAEKVYQTAKEVHKAMQEIGKFYPIAFWNEKIYTTGERLALEKLLNDIRLKDICEYFGFQSLGTSNSKVEKYVKMAKAKGYKGLDIEIGTITKPLPEIEDKFKKDKSLGIEDVVILTPHISKELDDENFKKYALSINGIHKDKFKLIEYIQKYKTKEEFIIGDDMKLYVLKKGVKGNFVKWLQEILEVEYGFENTGGWDGDFGSLTENQVKEYQKRVIGGLQIDGIIGKDTTIILIENSENPDYWMRKLQIMMAFEK